MEGTKKTNTPLLPARRALRGRRGGVSGKKATFDFFTKKQKTQKKPVLIS
jgi:hypothetical protein